MIRVIFFTTILCVSQAAISQDPKKLQKSWIKMTIENLSSTQIGPDTLYTRYTFDKSNLFISFYPGWDDYKQDWSVKRNILTTGFSTYRVDELTDTSLIISAEGFRKFYFLAEEYLTNQEKYLDSIGVYNGKPLYKANKFITPRYLTGKSLMEALKTNYEVPRANTFFVTFIVTENGEIENIRVVKGITPNFNDEIVKKLQATSKSWKAAVYKSKPIQTEMFYEIRYLDSIVR